MTYTAFCIQWEVSPRGYAVAPTQVSTVATPPATGLVRCGFSSHYDKK